MRHAAMPTICLLLILVSAQLSTAQKPGLVVQTGHSNPVSSVAFSPDGKILASGGGDGTIKLWDISTGMQLRTITGYLNDVAFSPDGKIIASGSIASGSTEVAIRLWDVSTGTQLHIFNLTYQSVASFAFSPDGKILAGCNSDIALNPGEAQVGNIKLWDVSSGRELQTLNAHGVSSITFSPDGRILASVHADRTIKLWDVSTTTELRTLTKGSGGPVVFSPDGKILASGSISDIVIPGELPTTTIKLWDVSTGTELRTLAADYLAHPVAFSPDGKILAINSIGIKLCDVSTGIVLRTFIGFSGGAIAFSPDWKTLALGGDINTIQLRDVATGKELRTLTGHPPGIYSVAFSPDGKTLASGVGGGIDGMYGTIKLWDVSSSPEVRNLTGTGWVTSVAFSPDGKILASGTTEWNGMVKLWDVSTGAELGTYGPINSVFAFVVAFSPDGKILAAGSSDKTVRLLNVPTGAELRTLTGHSERVSSVAFSPDRKTLASGSTDGAIKLWDVSTGAELHTLQGDSGWDNSAAFSHDGKILATGNSDRAIKLWDVSTGTELRTLTKLGGGSVFFSPDGKILASVNVNQPIKLWDVSTGALLRTLATNSLPKRAAFIPQSNYLVIGDIDSSIEVWDVNSAEKLATLIPFGDRDWLVAKPDGLFDGTPVAWSQLLWRFNNNTFDHAPVEAFYFEFYYPDLLSDIFAGKLPKAPSDIEQKDRRQPQLRLGLSDAQPDVMLTTRNVRVKIEVLQAPAGAQDARLFRNGSLVKVWRGDVLKGQNSATLEATIPIIAGENRLTAYAFNHDNIKSLDATLVVVGADSLKRPGTAYVLAVGINSYSNPNYNLKYAMADAEDFSAEFKRQQERLKNYGRVEIITLYDQQATKANILETLSQLATKAQPEDAIIVYFSCHGVAQDRRFYLVPFDLGYQGERRNRSAKDLQTILQHSISDRELEQAFEKMDAGQLLTVVDACNSGQALDAEEKRRGPMNSIGLAQLAYEKGMYILTAAQSYQAAWEASRLGHGFLTYSLIEEGLKEGKADRKPKDNQIVLREWLDYATERVPQMQEEKMKEKPQVKDQQGKLIEFVFVPGDEGIKDPAKRSVQRPRVFYRREVEPLPLVVARPQSAPT